MLNINISNPKHLSDAILSAYKFADNTPHNSLPTCQVMVQTADNGLRLTATDLYTSVVFAVNSSKVISEGEFCIPAKNLLSLGTLIKYQSAISLEQTDDGVNLSLDDAPTFGAKFEVNPIDEFPMLPETDSKAHWIEFNPEHVKIINSLTKYAATDNHRVGFDAVQFAMSDDTLYAYCTNGKTLAYAELGRTRIPNFAIPVEAVKKALQVTNTPDLKKSAWRVTLPTKDREVISIQIQDTAVKVRAGDAIDLTKYIMRHRNHNGENDDYIAFDTKALTNGIKKVSKLFISDKRIENILIIEGNPDGNITMTAKPVTKKNYSTLPQYAADMQAEYIHDFDNSEVECVTSANHFRIQVDGRKFQNMVRDLAVSKPERICVQSKYGIPDADGGARLDAVIVSGTDVPLGFIAMPAKM